MTISSSGANLVIVTSGSSPSTFTYNKENVSAIFNGSSINIKNLDETVFCISNNATVTSPSNTSLSDLSTKINALLA